MAAEDGPNKDPWEATALTLTSNLPSTLTKIDSMSKAERRKKTPSVSSEKSRKTAKAPFNENKLADIIVTSSDNVDFYLVRAILIIASSFFEDMFSLDQPVTAESGRGLDSIQITEDSETFDFLMRLCYPVKDPTMSDLGLVERVLAGAIKYQMNEATDLVKSTLQEFITEKPLQVYAIACRQQADEEALLAAQRWKTVTKFNDLDPQFTATTLGKSYVPEMDTISATAYFRLLHFVRNGTFPTTSVGTTPTKNAGDTASKLFEASILSTADITLRSFDGVDHPANSIILRAASAEKLLEEPRVEPSPGSDIPIISVGLHSSVLSDIISFCYPLSTTKFEKPEQIRKVAEVAQKYDMSLVIEAVKRQLGDMSHKYPLPAYFTSIALGWDAEAQHAARCAVEQNIDPYTACTPEMDDVPARHYRSLLKYQHRFVQCMQGEVGTTVTEARELSRALVTKSSSLVHFIPAITLKTLSDFEAAARHCSCCGRNPGVAQKVVSPSVPELVSKGDNLRMKLAEVRLCRIGSFRY